MTDLSWPTCSLTWLHDTSRCLALIAQERLHLTPEGHLPRSALQTLARCTVRSSPAPVSHPAQQTSDLVFLLELLQRAGMVAAVGQRLLLSKKALAWLDQPAIYQLSALRQVWFHSLESSWCWLPDDRRSSLLDRRWRYVLLEALQEVVILPLDSWTPTTEVIGALEARNLLNWSDVAQNLPRVRRSVHRRTRQVLDFVLEQILPRLALAEGHRQGETVFLRPTAEGAAWLRAALARSKLFSQPPDGVAVEQAVPHYELRFPSTDEPPISVAPDLAADSEQALILTLHLAAPAAYTFDVAHFARLLSPGPPARYHITPSSLHQAAGRGYPISDVIFLLTRFNGGPLSPAVATQLDAWRSDIIHVPCEPGYRLCFSAPVLLKALRRREPFRRRTLPFPSGQEAWVSRAESHGLFRYLRRLGYEPALPEEEAHGASLQEWPQRRPLPLLQWLVLLRTYQGLRRRLPALADLGLGELEQALEAALPSPERAAAERLIASHDGLLAQAITPSTAPGTPDDGAALSLLDAPQEASSVVSDVALKALLACLESAIQAGTPLTLTYADAQGRVTRRRVQPLRLDTHWRRPLLVAYCELRQDQRTFRLDRIVAVDGRQ